MKRSTFLKGTVAAPFLTLLATGAIKKGEGEPQFFSKSPVPQSIDFEVGGIYIFTGSGFKMIGSSHEEGSRG